MSEVNNLIEFLQARELGEEDFSQVKKNTSDNTNCGAWITEDEQGIKVGANREGCDHGTDPHEVNYPFEISSFWAALSEVEQEAEIIWPSGHSYEGDLLPCRDPQGCEDCGEMGEDGRISLNPECETCIGFGANL